MAYTEEETRKYVHVRFPHATNGEQEKLVNDWLTKDKQSEGIAKDFERRIGPLTGLRILDAGSGNGGVSIAFANHGAEVEGVEIESELVEIARAEAAEKKSSARFTLYEGTTLPFPDQSFDAAVSVSVIEHVDNPLNYLSEILRVLKPGGTLYLGFPNRLNPKETHTGLWGLSYLPYSIARAYVRMAGHNPLEDNGLHFYSYWAMRRMLRAAAHDNRSFELIKESGRSTNPLKRTIKNIFSAFGIPHHALLPHVMLILRAR